MTTSFGRYELIERIGGGGMAEVFKARSTGAAGFEKIVAIKRVLPHIANDAEFIEMFVEEARISANLTHANIAQVFEFGKVEGTYFIAMEYVQGKDLHSIQQQFRLARKPMPIPLALHVLTQVCAALDYAHGCRDTAGNTLRIVHCDVSPHNVLISFEGAVKLIDFGIARARSLASRTAGTLEGKYAYMSPEQVEGLEVDQRTDIFSAGILLYECLTGERLFVAESEPAVIEVVRRAEVAPPSSKNPLIRRPLDEIVARALARARDDRYETAEELRLALEKFAQTSRLNFTSKQLSRWMKTTFSKDRQAPRPPPAPSKSASRPPTRAPLPQGHRPGGPPSKPGPAQAGSARLTSPDRPQAPVRPPMIIDAPTIVPAGNVARAPADDQKETLPLGRRFAGTMNQANRPVRRSVQDSAAPAPAAALSSLDADELDDEASTELKPRGLPSFDDVHDVPTAVSTAATSRDDGPSDEEIDDESSTAVSKTKGPENPLMRRLRQEPAGRSTLPGFAAAGARSDLASTLPIESASPAATKDSELLEEAASLDWDDGPTRLELVPEAEAATAEVEPAPAVHAPSPAPAPEFDVGDLGAPGDLGDLGDLQAEQTTVTPMAFDAAPEPPPSLAPSRAPPVSPALAPSPASPPLAPQPASPPNMSEEPWLESSTALQTPRARRSSQPRGQPPPSSGPAVANASDPMMGDALPGSAGVGDDPDEGRLSFHPSAAVIRGELGAPPGAPPEHPPVCTAPYRPAAFSSGPPPPSHLEPAMSAAAAPFALSSPAPPSLVRPLIAAGVIVAAVIGLALMGHFLWGLPSRASAPSRAADRAVADSLKERRAEPKAAEPKEAEPKAAEPKSGPLTVGERVSSETDRAETGAAAAGQPAGKTPGAAPPKPRAKVTLRRPRPRRSTRVRRRPARARRSARASKRGRRARRSRSKAARGSFGFLIIASRPRAKVYVDGRYIRRSTPIRPASPLKLSPGRHSITLVARGQRFRFTVPIRSGKMSKLARLLPVRR